jgi:hypothetical protein
MICSFVVLLAAHHRRQAGFASNPAVACRRRLPATGSLEANFTNCVHTVDRNKTTLYRLHNPDLTAWQGGLWMTKDETDLVESASKSIGKSSQANTALETRPPLVLGDRVRISALGRARHPSYADLQGVIVGRGSPSSWRIKFDQRKCVQALHQAYLEKVIQSGIRCSGPSDIEDLSRCVADLA